MYKSLLKVLNVSTLTNEEITMIQTISLGILESIEILSRPRNLENGEHPFPDELKVEVIFIYKHRKFTKKTIRALMNLDIYKIKYHFIRIK